mgnify:FL=1
MYTKRSIVLALTALTLLVAPVSAGGATQISGLGYWDDFGECVDPVTGPEGQSPDFALKLNGDLEGCFYVVVKTAECRPSGVYMETGYDIFVGDEGTFTTTYRFTAKYEDCPNLIGEKFGRCQHPIIAGTGTGAYDGVTGHLSMKDDLVAFNFPYKGHLKW